MKRFFRWLAEAFRAWTRNFLPLTAMVAIPLVIEAVISTVCESRFPEMAQGKGSSLGMTGADYIASIGSVFFLFAAWAGSFIFLAEREGGSETAGWWRAYLRGFKCIPAFFGVGFLMGAAGMALAVPGLILWKLGVTLPAYVAFGLAALGFVYLLGRWSLSYPILAVEGGAFSQAMRRSGAMTRTVIVAVVVFNILVTGAPILIEELLNLLLSDPFIVSFALNLVFTAFGFASTFIIYNDLKKQP